MRILTPLVLFLLALADKKEKSCSAGAMAGGALGVAIGNRLLHDEDFEFSKGALISCAQIAGGLLAGASPI